MGVVFSPRYNPHTYYMKITKKASVKNTDKEPKEEIQQEISGGADLEISKEAQGVEEVAEIEVQEAKPKVKELTEIQKAYILSNPVKAKLKGFI